ncbi:MAG: hypothetical protein GY745_05925 [Actinomycetia bacterium]|nr:hypothetical protein [Actinomycetes bacterium]MCP4084573.1 hypothetical protein [Actinomycetes bacterium]
MRYEEVELGDDLPEAHPDVSLDRIKLFADAAGMFNMKRFTDHEYARGEGFAGAIVPGIMSQGLLASMIHGWAPGARIKKLDTVFRTPVLVDSTPTCSGAVTDTDDDARTVEIDLTLVNEDGSTGVLGTAIVEMD